MTKWIERAFFDGQHYPIEPRELPKWKDEYHASALAVLDKGTADHVVYCHIEYDADGECTGADFYSGLEMDDATFYERTREIPGTDFIGAVHRHK
jgi:hypothetical protein